MPTISTIITFTNELSDQDAVERGRNRALQAMSQLGDVDESTIKLDDLSRNATINYGTDEDPILVGLEAHGLMTLRFSAQAQPHDPDSVPA